MNAPPKRRTLKQMEADGRAVALRQRHLTYDQIAEQLGCSKAAAYQAVKRGLLDTLREPADYVRNMEVERYDEMARVAWGVVYRTHYVVGSSGKVALHPESGQPLVDDGPRLAGIDRLLKISKARRELLGLDEPSRVEVTTYAGVDADIARLVAELAARGQGPVAGHPDVFDVAGESPTGSAPTAG